MADPTIDSELSALCSAGDFSAATALAIRKFGPEIMGLLVALSRNDSAAADAYSLFCERVWQGLPKFRFESSFRTWAYVVARRTMTDVRRAAGRQPHVVGAAPSQLPDAVEQARSETRSYLKTERKVELRELRAELSEDDQLLLVLRIDRNLAWDEIARVFAEPDADAAALKRQSASLRKRFERAKAKLGAAIRAQRGS
ncbi:MAG: sigma-70 family RNA polymerase sigma factor [Myxococcota bacterium]